MSNKIVYSKNSLQTSVDVSNSKKKNVVITKETTRRLIKDVRDVMRHPLSDNGIYYVHDETNMLKGYALIIGPSDTIYRHGFYFFEFTFPTNYPHSPPKVVFYTNDGQVRFHPNLYRNGKVCLSILNTWSGEQWSSCQSLRTVLLTMITLFHNKSLLNEPGIREDHEDFEGYHKVIEYKNYTVACLGMIEKKYMVPLFEPFYSIITSYFYEHSDEIKKRLVELNQIYQDKPNVDINVYNHMVVNLDYEKIIDDFDSIKRQLLNR